MLVAEIQHTLKPISEDERKDLELKTQQMTKPEAGQETEQGAERATAKKTKQHASPKKRDIEHQTQKEIDTMRKMIEIYCRGQHSSEAKRPRNEFCDECSSLFEYALSRIERCPYKETKNFCSNCTTHCYKPEMRERIRQVMRYSGPRMLLHNPLMAISHVLSYRKAQKRNTR